MANILTFMEASWGRRIGKYQHLMLLQHAFHSTILRASNSWFRMFLKITFASCETDWNHVYLQESWEVKILSRTLHKQLIWIRQMSGTDARWYFEWMNPYKTAKLQNNQFYFWFWLAQPSRNKCFPFLSLEKFLRQQWDIFRSVRNGNRKGATQVNNVSVVEVLITFVECLTTCSSGFCYENLIEN
jgi:hypothetical protein